MTDQFEIIQVQVIGPLSKRGGSKPEYSENPPNNEYENRWNTLAMKNPVPDMSEPPPSNTGDKFAR